MRLRCVTAAQVMWLGVKGHRRFRASQIIWLAPYAVVLVLGSSPTAAVAAGSAPVNVSRPRIQAPRGQARTEVTKPQEGRILIGTAGTWTGTPPPSYSYRWEHCDIHPPAPIAGAIDRTYQIAPGDIGHKLCLRVTAKNPDGNGQATSAPTGVVKIGTPLDRSAPKISGLARVGQTLTASPGVWAGTAPFRYVYQWRRCDRTGAKCGPRFTAPSPSPTYVVRAADLGHRLVVYVRATNAAGSSSVNSHPTAVVTRGGAGSPVNNVRPARIRALLRKALAAHGRRARIGAVLTNHGYPLSFAAPSPGQLVIAWYHPSPQGKKVLVAVANFVFRGAGTSRIKLVLTGKGATLLRGARHLKITANGRFMRAGHRPISETRSFTLQP
jgi:hypothetical protein